MALADLVPSLRVMLESEAQPTRRARGAVRGENLDALGEDPGSRASSSRSW